MSTNDTSIVKCPPAEELTALLYNELAPGEREKFEDHLTDCFACVDEFAELSEARLSAYEWNRDEFEHLATPAIRIDYLQPIAYRWFAGLKQRLVFAVPAVAFGAVILTLIGGYINFTGPDLTETASQTAQSSPKAVESVDPVPRTVETTVNPGNDRDIEKSRVTRVAAVKPKAERNAVSRKASRDRKPVIERNEALVARQANLPRLTNTAEVGDTTLRLADVFSELDVNE